MSNSTQESMPTPDPIDGLLELHQESRDWISRLEFLVDESRFLVHRLQVNEEIVLKEDDKKEHHYLDTRLHYINQTLLHDVLNNIRGHEIYLADLLKAEKGYDDSVFRNIHVSYRKQVEIVEAEMKSLKERVFKWVEIH